MKDYYSLLGVVRTATKGEIKKNYRLLANKFHPDKNPDPEAATKFIEITEAYDVLSNKKSRAQYDLYRWQEMKQQKERVESYTVVTPPIVSTRTRRNRAQRARSVKYHQSKSNSDKSFQLIRESGQIVSRYILHILGITLFGVILSSAIGHLLAAFEENILRGFFVAVLVAIMIYVVFWIIRNALQEFEKDMDVFSVFFKLSRKKAVTYTLSVFALVLFLYITLLVIRF